MQNLKNKLKKHGGFTLVEMLIVVAIIAILVAVSIPLVSSSMDKTRHATDQANERAAKAEILLQFLAGTEAMVDGSVVSDGLKTGNDDWYFYDAKDGDLSISEVESYGQCQKGKHVGGFIKVKVDSNGKVTMEWAAGTGTSTNVTSDLCTDKKVDHT